MWTSVLTSKKCRWLNSGEHVPMARVPLWSHCTAPPSTMLSLPVGSSDKSHQAELCPPAPKKNKILIWHHKGHRRTAEQGRGSLQAAQRYVLSVISSSPNSISLCVLSPLVPVAKLMKLKEKSCTRM